MTVHPLRRARGPLAAVALVVLAAACAVDLGTLGGRSSRATGINDEGVIVGTSENAFGQTHAFKRTPGEVMRDLGALNSGRSEAKAVNSTGVVVGTSGFVNPDGSVVNHAVRWNADNTITDLGTVTGASASANAINDDGTIVGTLTFNDLDTRAFVWSPANPTLTQLPGIGTPYTAASGINNGGQIVGTAIVDAIPNVQAVLWTPGSAPGSYVAASLGTGSGVSGAAGINDFGVVVGHWSTAFGARQQAARWSAGAHQVTLLPAGALGSFATAVNDAGTIVGTSVTVVGGTGGTQAWRWRPGDPAVRDLGNLGGNRATADAINDGGVAAGSGEKPDHSTHAARFDAATAAGVMR